MPDEDVVKTFADYMPETVSDSTLKDNLKLFGQADRDDPSYILIYADTFASKDEISTMISDYNAQKTSEGEEEDVIHYTDYVALMMSSISTIINVISYVLIAFVSISLVVSSIMIGIITYISVLEKQGNRYSPRCRCVKEGYFPCIQCGNSHHRLHGGCNRHRNHAPALYLPRTL